ncbi:hypothetical protein OF83DRAFT_1089397, partial [Amylostereum chailletii]
MTADTARAFRALARPLTAPENGVTPMELFPRRWEVDKANGARLAGLASPIVLFHAEDSGSAPPDQRATLLGAMSVPGVLQLKSGAQVMLVRNVDETCGLVNGAVGIVRGFFTALGKRRGGVVRELAFDEEGIAREPAALGEGQKAGKEDVSMAGHLSASDGYPYVDFDTPQGK